MKLHGIDVAIIVGYLLTVSLIGVCFSRRASKNLNSYLLGGKSCPGTSWACPMPPACSTSPARCGW